MNRFRTPQSQHGALDWRRLADMHKPTDGEALQAEIRRLRGTGLTPYDIAQALHIGVAAVEQALGRNV